MQTKHFIMFYRVIKRTTLLRQFLTVFLSMGVFKDGARKKYSSFPKILTLPFPENMDKPLLKIDIDQS